MALRSAMCATALAAVLIPASVIHAGSVHHVQIGLIRHDNVRVYVRPSTASRVLTSVMEQNQIEVLTRQRSWSHVELWASVRGWIQSADILIGKPWPSTSTYQAPVIHFHVQAQSPRPLNVWGVATARAALQRDPSSSVIGWLALGAQVKVTSWQQDAAGRIWYRVRGSWVLGSAVRFETPNPAFASHAGRPLWTRVAGKGMWLTLGTVTQTAPDVLVRAAMRNGISHFYVEAAISPLGFHGRGSVGPLVEAAHRHGIAVIAWVYPYLYDLASDIGLTREVAAYRTAHSETFDGMALDLERNVHPWTVRAYSQLVRAYLGPSYLIVGVTYPPQDFPTYPFAEVGRQDNVIAPMDYWHQTKSGVGMYYGHMPYGYSYARRYAADSVALIHAAGGTVPIAPIGQTFDDFGRLEMGPYAPSAAEVQGFLVGCKASGAIGASFFQWMTATDSEWRSIGDTKFGTGSAR